MVEYIDRRKNTTGGRVRHSGSKPTFMLRIDNRLKSANKPATSTAVGVLTAKATGK
jgi:hypothetical protein